MGRSLLLSVICWGFLVGGGQMQAQTVERGPAITNEASSPPGLLRGKMRPAAGNAPNENGDKPNPPVTRSRVASRPSRDTPPPTDSRPADTDSDLPRDPAPPRSTGARGSSGSGVLPNDAGQVWREYDLTPYTSRVTSSEKPEQAVVDWILRDTGTEVWFSEPLGILSADKKTLRVYHTPEMQTLIAQVVDRFVNSAAEAHMLSVRLVTVGSPNWRAKAYPLLKPVSVQSPGVEAWLVSKENAAFLLADLARRTDFRDHNSPNLVIHNGQSHTISQRRPKSYVRSVRARDGVIPGFDADSVDLQEGYSLQISPLFSLDRKTVDAVIKCDVDQVEKLIPVTIELPAFAGQKQRAQVQVPQMVSWRLHERFRWPTDQVLLLSCGVVAAPAPETGGAVGIVNALTTTIGRADALMFVDCQGRAQGNPRESERATTTGSLYRGRY